MRRLLLAALVCAAVASLPAEGQSRGKSSSGSPGRRVSSRGHFSGFHRGHSGFGHHGFHQRFHRPRFHFGFGHRKFQFGFGFGRHHGGFFHHRKKRFHGFRYGYPVYYPSYVPYYSSTYNGRYNGPYRNGYADRQPVRYDDELEYDDSRYGEHYFDARENQHRHHRAPYAPQEEEGGVEEVGPSTEPSEDARSREATRAVLVLRDGGRLEMANYATTDQAVYHLQSGVRARRIRLTEIDLPATRRLNQELGLDFRLPGEKPATGGMQ